MSLLAKYQTHVDALKAAKEEYTRTNDGDDAPSVVTVFREGNIIATGYTAVDRDVLVKALTQMIIGFGAEAVVCATETLMARVEHNPLTGMPWEQGDMQAIAELHPEYLKDGTLEESLTVMIYEREGDHLQMSIPFIKEGTQVQWGEMTVFDSTESNEEGISMGGAIHEILTHAFSKDAPRTKLFNELETLPIPKPDNSVALFHVMADFAAALSVMKSGQDKVVVTLTAEPGSERDEILRDRGADLMARLSKDMGMDGRVEELRISDAP